MKNLNFVLLVTFLAIIVQVEGALPPLYQTSSEIKAILEDKQLGQKLESGEVITKIKKNEQGYVITTNQHRLQIYVSYEPPQRPGPAHFKLSFGDPSPLLNN